MRRGGKRITIKTKKTDRIVKSKCENGDKAERKERNRSEKKRTSGRKKCNDK